MATAELAVAMPALVLVLALLLAAIGFGVDQVRCLDGARAGARLAARGETPAVAAGEARRLAPPDAAVSVSSDGDRVTVSVSSAAPTLLRWLGMRAAPAVATAQRESALAGLPP